MSGLQNSDLRREPNNWLAVLVRVVTSKESEVFAAKTVPKYLKQLIKGIEVLLPVAIGDVSALSEDAGSRYECAGLGKKTHSDFDALSGFPV
jgi:hypothetical protein